MSLNRSEMIRLAASLPPASPQRIAILAQLGREVQASVKIAGSVETEAFINWALSQKRMSADAAQRILEQKLGVEAEQPVEGPSTRKTGPLRKGEVVIVNARNNISSSNRDACETYHNRVGMVEEINSDGYTVAFYRGDNTQPSTDLSGDKQFFEGLTPGKENGLYRWTPKPAYQGGIENRVMLEAVYLRAGKQVDIRSREQIQQYIEKGQNVGENRSDVYYSGPVGKFAIGKDGTMYFAFSAQQRDRPTAINPEKGKLFYLGVLGKRPGGWKADAINMGFLVP